MKIVITDDCQKEIRRLSKKYISIINDFRNLLDTLQQNPF